MTLGRREDAWNEVAVPVPRDSKSSVGGGGAKGAGYQFFFLKVGG